MKSVMEGTRSKRQQVLRGNMRQQKARAKRNKQQQELEEELGGNKR